MQTSNGNSRRNLIGPIDDRSIGPKTVLPLRGRAFVLRVTPRPSFFVIFMS
jgi:hypothetical protein